MCSLPRTNTDRGVMFGDGQSRFSINGKPIYHLVGTSTFSEYTVVHVGCVAKINPQAPLDKVCVLAVESQQDWPKKGMSVAVFGLGAVGLAAAEGAGIAGASRSIGVYLNPRSFEEAKKFGVTELIVVHRDIKSTNVLLDQDLIPKISDFGLPRLGNEEKTYISTRVAGSIGFMAPEYAMHGFLTVKADVYSFGVVALEIISGKSITNFSPESNHINLVNWAFMLRERGNIVDIVDPSLGSTFNEEAINMEEVARKDLKASGGDIEKATDWIFSQPDASGSVDMELHQAMVQVLVIQHCPMEEEDTS
ncbi:hypothetical protein ACLOJK_026177 [Asimina triloba]